MSPTLAQRGFKCIEHDTHAGDGLLASLWWQSLVLVRQLGPPLIQFNQGAMPQDPITMGAATRKP